MTLVEKMAKAMALCRNFQFDGFDDVTKQKYLRQALAALKAMREPSKAMLSAWPWQNHGSGHERAIWQAMVDAAIQEHYLKGLNDAAEAIHCGCDKYCDFDEAEETIRDVIAACTPKNQHPTGE